VHALCRWLEMHWLGEYAASERSSPCRTANKTSDDVAAHEMPDDFAELRNEAAVELRVIVPLFQSLGYELSDFSPKHPVVFQEGRTGRRHEADFVLFAGPLHNDDTSLVVVEAKSPEEDLDAGKRQAGSYALATRAPILLTCDGNVVEVWQLNLARSSDKVLSFAVSHIEARRAGLERYLRKETVIDYCRRVCGKTIVEATADFGRYEDAELRRTLSFDRSIDRRLKHFETGSVISSCDLLDGAATGAVIAASSGIGKTDLSNKMLRSQISRRRHDGTGRVPVHIPLLDLGSDESILVPGIIGPRNVL
jgi:Type I restriction enzyme R protein N terminus (HSDR_N)